MLEGLEIDEDKARTNVYSSGAVSTALSPLLGYNRAAKLAREMNEQGSNIFEANEKLGLLDPKMLEKLMQPDKLLKKGFTMNDIRECL